MTKTLCIISAFLVSTTIVAAPLPDFQFKSPAFNGAGFSSHVLTIENQEAVRQKAQQDKIQAAIDKAASEAKNTNLSKFLSNLESRIYAQISQNVATSMFSNNSCSLNAADCQGSITFQGSTIAWSRVSDAINCTGSTNGTCILLNVTDTAGSTTAIYVPLESFQMPGL